MNNLPLFIKDNGKHPSFPVFLILQDKTSLGSISFTYDMYKVLRSLKTCQTNALQLLTVFKQYFEVIVIAFPLSCLFSMSMESGILPSVWKVGYMCPIFKKGFQQRPCNYSPVSTTSICCKVMESIVSESLVHFLRVNGLISKDQYGFH